MSHPATLPGPPARGSLLPSWRPSAPCRARGLHRQAAWFIRLGGCDGLHLVRCMRAGTPPRIRPFRGRPGGRGPGATGTHRGDTWRTRMHELGPRTYALRAAGFRTHIETSGRPSASGEWHGSASVRRSSAHRCRRSTNCGRTSIVYNRHDLEWPWACCARSGSPAVPAARVGLSRGGDALVTAQVQAHPQWRISLQTH